VRRVEISEFARAALRHAAVRYPSIEAFFQDAIVWSLERMPDLPGELQPGFSDDVFAFDSKSWKAEGLPDFSVAYRHTQQGIEIVYFALLDS
jgi:hypothetical protein